MDIIKKYRTVIFALVSIAIWSLILAVGPLDIFTHGYFYDDINIQEAKNDLKGPINLSDGAYIMHFTPTKNHFVGFAIMLTEQRSKDHSLLSLEISDGTGKELETIEVNSNKVKNETWYYIYSNAGLKKGEQYTLKISANEKNIAPSLVAIDTDYLGEEVKDSSAAIVFAYAKSTFNFAEKVLISLFLISIWLYLTTVLLSDLKYKNIISKTALLIFLTSALSWNFMFNSLMTGSNKRFNSFQADSEAIVTGTLYAQRDGIGGLHGYGLGRYTNALGTYYRNSLTPIDDENWNRGYSRNEPSIIINSNGYTQSAVEDLAKVRFENGDEFDVSEVTNDGKNIIIALSSDRLLNPGKYGEVDKITFINSKGKEAEPSRLGRYTSQFGLQGKILRHIAELMPADMDILTKIEHLHLICALATAAVFVAIVQLLAVKFGLVMACVFYLTFGLSPSTVNFARNLYWVEFTWFIPMAIGLVCSLKITDKKWRRACYCAAFISILVKCLCGYEYITTVLMGLIIFLAVDLVVAFRNGSKEKILLLIKSIFIIGICALLGFIAALCMHAVLRGEGNILNGLKTIFFRDVLRRTVGGDLNEFSQSYWNSFNASAWEVYCRYFKFSTKIVADVPARAFPLLCCAPLSIFAFDYRRNKLKPEYPALYAVSFLTSVSWFILAKSHSYIHTHMNYVLWYFGFIQICFFVCVDKLVEIYKTIKENRRQ